MWGFVPVRSVKASCVPLDIQDSRSPKIRNLWSYISILIHMYENVSLVSKISGRSFLTEDLCLLA